VAGLTRDSVSNLYMYTWAGVVGKAFNTTSYCARSGSANGPICVFSNPKADHFSIHYKPIESDIKNSMALLAATGNNFVRLTVIGDAQATDCNADALSGTMSVVYDIP
jgi:hypothetical protein